MLPSIIRSSPTGYCSLSGPYSCRGARQSAHRSSVGSSAARKAVAGFQAAALKKNRGRQQYASLFIQIGSRCRVPFRPGGFEHARPAVQEPHQLQPGAWSWSTISNASSMATMWVWARVQEGRRSGASPSSWYHHLFVLSWRPHHPNDRAVDPAITRLGSSPAVTADRCGMIRDSTQSCHASSLIGLPIQLTG